MRGAHRRDRGPGADERALVARLRAGDEAAFEELFDGSFQGLYRFALRRVGGDVELAKEVAQAAFCTAFQKLDGFRGEAPLFTWLCAICRSEISHHFRRRKRLAPSSEEVERRPAEGEDDLVPGEMAGVSPGNPERDLLDAELAGQVHEIVDGLPARYGRALVWKYGEGLTVAEIGARLGTTTKAAESLLTRARVAFRSGFIRAGGRLPGRALCARE
jgi:RNA polymerase sigma-70 factor (ECF subfamily)